MNHTLDLLASRTVMQRLRIIPLIDHTLDYGCEMESAAALRLTLNPKVPAQHLHEL